MLEEIFALAEAASNQRGDVQGFGFQWGASALLEFGSKPFWSPPDPAKPPQ